MNKANMLSTWTISVSLLVLILGQSTIHAEDATVDDVLKGKTFSNSNATGLEGIRPPAPVERTGQTSSYEVGDDGFHEKGVPWPDPRFSAGEEVVTDNLTGLMWQKSLNTTRTYWLAAMTYCDQLSIVEGSPFGTIYIDWRLPNIKELLSLIDSGQYDPTLPSGHPFTGINTSFSYWSSTHDARDFHIQSYTVEFQKGMVEAQGKTEDRYIWCVRGGYGGIAY